MHLDLNSILEHTIPIDAFQLKWRFAEDENTKIPEEDLQRLKPLDDDASKFLWNYVADSNLHDDFPFKKGYFQRIEQLKIFDGNEKKIREWLINREIPAELVFLSWQPTTAMIVPWEIFIKYFDSFYYGSSDDLTVFDQNLNWAFLFFHEDEVYFGKSVTK